MILDADDIEFNSAIKADVCIIGAGPAGITIARELIGTKFNVVLLESGGRVPDEKIQQLNKGKNIGLPYYELQEARSRAFGGTSHKWHIKLCDGHEGVRLRGLDKIDFEKRSWVPNSGWPFTKEELNYYYKRAHEIFKIGPYSYNVEDWEEIDSGEVFFKESNIIETTVFQFARKNIFYQEYSDEIEKAKNITTYLNSTVLNITANENTAKIKKVVVATSDKKEFIVKAGLFILATGGLENPRLLLLSNNVMKCGLGNQNGLVGRYFMEHPHLWSGIFSPSDLNRFNYDNLYRVHNSKGTPIMGKLALDEAVLRSEKLLNLTASLQYEPMVVMNEAVRSLKKVKQSFPSNLFSVDFNKHLKNVAQNFDSLTYGGLRQLMAGEKEKWYDHKKEYHGYKLNLMTEQVPEPDSRVILGSEKDRFGQRKIKLNWKLSPQDIDSIDRGLNIIKSEVYKYKLGKLYIAENKEEMKEGIHGGWHHMGTTRMHENPKQGVVDKNCKVHNVDNLFVAGSSVFPTGGYANPTLTILALALRLADYIKINM